MISVLRLGGVIAMVCVAMTASYAQETNTQSRVRPIPLGGSLSGQRGDQYFGVYVPTRYGGNLTVKTTLGTVESITGPNGKPIANGEDTGANSHGWYVAKVTVSEGDKDKDKDKDKDQDKDADKDKDRDKEYEVSCTFIQNAQSARLPWNFYYWPTKSDAIHEPWSGGNGRVDTMQVFGDDVLVATPGGYIAPGQDIVRAGPNGLLETPVSPGDDSTWFPNLYDDLSFRGADNNLYQTPAPLLKYDQLLSSTARNWEAANSQNQDIQRWPGHCLGGAVASIMLAEPIPAPGTGLTRDELKSLWAELGENHYNHRIGEHANDIPAGPPRPGPDACDYHAAKFQLVMEEHIRGRKKALLANLRAFPPRGTTNEVWNHGVGKYVATYANVPGRGERSVKISMELFANSGSCLNGNDDKPRINKYEYIVVYGLDGKVDETNVYANDWISVGGEAMFAPLNVMEVLDSRWAGHNPFVSESNVRRLDMANGGGAGGLGGFGGGPAPTFRPVNSYEAGRAPIFSNGINGAMNDNGSRDGVNPNSPFTPSPRRGGLFGVFRRAARD